MVQTDDYREERIISRSDKIQDAKSAFLPSAMPVYSGRNQGINAEGKKHSLGLFRMLMAGMLFLILVLAFHFNFSYHGFNKEYVEKLLADNRRWEAIVNQVSEVMKAMQ